MFQKIMFNLLLLCFEPEDHTVQDHGGPYRSGQDHLWDFIKPRDDVIVLHWESLSQ